MCLAGDHLMVVGCAKCFRCGRYVIDPYLTHKLSQQVVILTAIGARFCSRKAALQMRIPPSLDSAFGRLCGPLLGKSHSDDSFGAFSVDFSWPSR